MRLRKRSKIHRSHRLKPLCHARKLRKAQPARSRVKTQLGVNAEIDRIARSVRNNPKALNVRNVRNVQIAAVISHARSN